MVSRWTRTYVGYVGDRGDGPENGVQTLIGTGDLSGDVLADRGNLGTHGYGPETAGRFVDGDEGVSRVT